MAVGPTGLLDEAGVKAQLEEVHLGGRHDPVRARAVGLEQTPQPVGRLEGLAGSAGHHGEIVGGVSQLGLVPVDDTQLLLRIERAEQILAQQISVQEAGRRVRGRQAALAWRATATGCPLWRSGRRGFTMRV